MILAAAIVDAQRQRFVRGPDARCAAASRALLQELLRRPGAARASASSCEPGEVLGLVGENGSGKSTTMNILGGVHQPDAGAMTLDGAALRAARARATPPARGIAFIHQELNLFENLTIEENLFIGGFPQAGRRPAVHRPAQGARAHAASCWPRSSSTSPPGTPVAPPQPGRAAAGRDRQGAGRRRAHRHLRRADHLADRARERAAVRA